MINRLTKKIAYVLCISSLMSLTTVQSMPEDNKNPEHGGDGKNILQNDKNPEQDSKTSEQDNKNPEQNCEIKNSLIRDLLNSLLTGDEKDIVNGLIGVQRDIFLPLSGMLFERQLRNMIGFSGESVAWLKHDNYIVSRKDGYLLEKLRKSLTEWRTLSLEITLESFHMVCNGQNVVIINRNKIHHSKDGKIYKRIRNSGIDMINDIHDVIVADGKYIATTGYSLFTSDDAERWKEYKCPNCIVKMAYDELNKMYYGISQNEWRGDDYRHRVYASKDIAKLGTCSSKIFDNLPDNSRFYTCCGNGMFVVSVLGRRATYYLKEDVLEKSDLKAIVFDMSYNPRSKCIVAVTKPSRISNVCNIYTTKDASHWEKEIVGKEYSINCYGTPAIATIDGYSVVMIESRNDVNILIRKRDEKWTKMNEEIIGVDGIYGIKKLIWTNGGIFMITSYNIKRAAGNINKTKYKSKFEEEDDETEFEDDVDYEDERIHAYMHMYMRIPMVNILSDRIHAVIHSVHWHIPVVNPANTENAAIVKYGPNIFEMKKVPSEVNANLFLQLSEILFRIQLRNIFDFSAEYMMLLNNDNIRLESMSRLLTNWEDVPLANNVGGSHIVSNGKTIVVAGHNGISCSIDGKAYNKTNNHYIKDIIVADGKYVATGYLPYNDNEILTSDDAMVWNSYPFKENHYINNLVYDDVNKMYYGIDETRLRNNVYRCNIYENEDITEFGKMKGKGIDSASSTSFYTCCGNGIFVASSGYRTYYFYKGSLVKSDLCETVMGMSYNPQSKRILAVTKPNSEYNYLNKGPISWNIHSTKNGLNWEKELNTKDDFNIELYESKYESYFWRDENKTVLTTIDSYSILFINQPVINILIRKNTGEWVKISEIRGINENHTVNRIVKTNKGIFMLTDYGIKKAVGDITPTLVKMSKDTHKSKNDHRLLRNLPRIKPRDPRSCKRWASRTFFAILPPESESDSDSDSDSED